VKELVEDAAIRGLLEGVRTIAVLGIKNGPQDDAFRVPRYLQERGYRIVPVNPKLEVVLGRPVVGSLREIEEPVDLVNVFRASAHVPAHVEEILALQPRPLGVWLQLGIRSDEAAARLLAVGVALVQDRCLMVEHGRLLGGNPS
jgi:predicted CoA-binding protein